MRCVSSRGDFVTRYTDLSAAAAVSAVDNLSEVDLGDDVTSPVAPAGLFVCGGGASGGSAGGGDGGTPGGLLGGNEGDDVDDAPASPPVPSTHSCSCARLSPAWAVALSGRSDGCAPCRVKSTRPKDGCPPPGWWSSEAAVLSMVGGACSGGACVSISRASSVAGPLGVAGLVSMGGGACSGGACISIASSVEGALAEAFSPGPREGAELILKWLRPLLSTSPLPLPQAGLLLPLFPPPLPSPAVSNTALLVPLWLLR